MATMRDVAQAARVSLKTVSRVVNAEPGVRPDTEARVRSAIEALRFRPNSVARSLRVGRALPLIGLVIGDQANPFYSAIARGVEAVALQHHHLVITGSSDDRMTRERDLVTTLCQQHVSGLLIVPARDDRHRPPPDLDARLPVVYLDRPPHHGEGDTVLLDNRGGARAGVDSLIAQGHRRIGVIGDILPFHTIDERISGYREAMSTAGLPIDPALMVLNARDTQQAAAATGHLLGLAQPPTALFTLNNRTCVGVLQAITRRAATVAVLGFDDLELAGLLSLPLTLITHDPVELGRAAARLLFARLNGETGPGRRIVLPTRLAHYP